MLKDSRSGKLRAIVQDVASLKDAQAVLGRLGDAVGQAAEAVETETGGREV